MNNEQLVRILPTVGGRAHFNGVTLSFGESSVRATCAGTRVSVNRLSRKSTTVRPDRDDHIHFLCCVVPLSVIGFVIPSWSWAAVYALFTALLAFDNLSFTTLFPQLRMYHGAEHVIATGVESCSIRGIAAADLATVVRAGSTFSALCGTGYTANRLLCCGTTFVCSVLLGVADLDVLAPILMVASWMLTRHHMFELRDGSANFCLWLSHYLQRNYTVLPPKQEHLVTAWAAYVGLVQAVDGMWPDSDTVVEMKAS